MQALLVLEASQHVRNSTTRPWDCTQGFERQCGALGALLGMYQECPSRLELISALLARSQYRAPAGSVLLEPRDTEGGPRPSALLGIDWSRLLGSFARDRMHTWHVPTLGMLEGHSFSP